MNVLVSTLLFPCTLLIRPQIFEDGATYRGRLKALGRQLTKTLYSDVIAPEVVFDCNSDQYARVAGESVTEFLTQSKFLLAKERDKHVRCLICWLLVSIHQNLFLI